MAKNSSVEKGRVMEHLCARYLENSGYTVLGRHWTCRYGELDIVARYGRQLVFVEVKSVYNTSYCDPIELMSERKISKMLSTVNYFLKKKKVFLSLYRLDLICLTKDSGRIWLEHYIDILKH